MRAVPSIYTLFGENEGKTFKQNANLKLASKWNSSARYSRRRELDPFPWRDRRVSAME